MTCGLLLVCEVEDWTDEELGDLVGCVDEVEVVVVVLEGVEGLEFAGRLGGIGAVIMADYRSELVSE